MHQHYSGVFHGRFAFFISIRFSSCPLGCCGPGSFGRGHERLRQHLQGSADAVTLYHEGNYPAAAQVIKARITKKDENFVLDNCRYGSAALAAGEIKDAENAFMAAYEVMNGVNTNNGGRTLGATLVYEGVKVWKGEPFERAMAHYYLGLIFLIEHDYENARAAFQNSLFKLNAYAKKDDTKDFRASESNLRSAISASAFVIRT